MKSLRDQLTSILADAFAASGFDRAYGKVEISNRSDLGQFQCNGALPAAKQSKLNPRQIAQQVIDALVHPEVFREVSLAGPGFMTVTGMKHPVRPLKTSRDLSLQSLINGI